MIRKLNYTGRKKISRSNIEITLLKNGAFPYFDASLQLDSLKLPGEAVIYIEPYYRSSFMRFNCGTADKFVLPESTYLNDLPESDIVYFRVKIVDESNDTGKVLAYADQIVPELHDKEKAQTQSLLPVQFSTDLGRQLWRLTFDDPKPVLEISAGVENGRDLVKSNEFISLVFPSILNEIFTRIIYDHREVDIEEEHWAASWLKYAKFTLNVYDKPSAEDDNLDELKEWVTEVVSTFCRRRNILKYYNKSGLIS